jgi:hypothetical protein
MKAPESISQTRHENIFKILKKKYKSCPIAAAHGKIADMEDLHHAMLHNTKVNRKCFPYFIHSALNILPVNHAWHLSNPSFGRLKGYINAEKYEDYLRRHPLQCAYLMGVIPEDVYILELANNKK